MAKSKKENLKGMDKKKLEEKLDVLYEEMRDLRFKSEGSRSKNVKEMSSHKRNVARILTQMNQSK